MKIAVANDHGAVELKHEIVKYLEAQGHEVINFGVDVAESVDYPIQGLKVARAVVDGVAERGIALCGTGIGISIACNKVKGIRAVVCSEPFSAKLSRQHNNSNILCMGGRVVGPELAKMIVQEWLDAEFEGGRHQRRVGEIREIEETGTIKEA